MQALLAEMQNVDPPPPSPPVWKRSQLFQPASGLASRKDVAGALWKRFRNAHPFGFQGIAVSSLAKDGTCAVVVTEPPPHVTFEELKAILPDASVMRQPVGHDGALFNVVGTIAGGEQEVIRKLRVLSQILFRTEHGAYAYQEPFGRAWQEAKQFSLDIHPSAAELHNWVYAPGAQFRAVDGDEVLARTQVMSSKTTGVYHLIGANVVAWWIPAELVVSDCVPEMRTFAVDSDLIIGGIKEAAGLLVLARKRVAPLELLPPLRAETIALLASVHGEDELKQSYQRMHPGAGPYSEQWDWAPILLSPVLFDRVQIQSGRELIVAAQ